MNRYLEYFATATAEDLEEVRAEARQREMSREGTAPDVNEVELQAIASNSQPARFPMVDGLTPGQQRA